MKHILMWTRAQISLVLIMGCLWLLASFARQNRTVVDTTATTTPHPDSSSSSSSSSSSTSSEISSERSSSKASLNTATVHGLPSHLGNCSEFLYTRPRDYSPQARPLWIPTFPNSAGPPARGFHNHNNVLRGLIAGLTGFHKGHKMYEVSSSMLHKCRTQSRQDIVVTCACAHPINPVEPAPEQQKDYFSPHMILPIRNPRTNIPAYLKHKTKPGGHVSEDEWRKYRDMHLTNAVNEWIAFFKDWRATSYIVSVYLDYDQMFSHESGVSLTKKVAKALEQANFMTALSSENNPNNGDNNNDDLISCTWHRAVEPIAQRERDSEFLAYTPGYTQAQQEYMINALEGFRNEVVEQAGNDQDELASLLQTYIEDIRQNTKLDQPYTG